MQNQYIYLLVSLQDENEWTFKDQIEYEYKFKKLQEYFTRYLKSVKDSIAEKFQKFEKQQQNQKSEGLAHKQQQQSNDISKGKDTKKKEEDEASLSYFDRYLTMIKDNIQIEITNVHIRLEDRQSNVFQEFVMNKTQNQGIPRNKYQVMDRVQWKSMAIGITLKKISIFTKQVDVISNDQKNSAQNQTNSDRQHANQQVTEQASGDNQTKQQQNTLDSIYKIDVEKFEISSENDQSDKKTDQQSKDVLEEDVNPYQKNAQDQLDKQKQKQFIYSRRENKGTPLVREVNVQGLSVYMQCITDDQDKDQTQFVTKIDDQGQQYLQSVEAKVDVDKAMQLLTQRVFEQVDAYSQDSQNGKNIKASDNQDKLNFLVLPIRLNMIVVEETVDLGSEEEQLKNAQQAFIKNQNEVKKSQQILQMNIPNSTSTVIPNKIEHNIKIGAGLGSNDGNIHESQEFQNDQLQKENDIVRQEQLQKIKDAFIYKPQMTIVISDGSILGVSNHLKTGTESGQGDGCIKRGGIQIELRKFQFSSLMRLFEHCKKYHIKQQNYNICSKYRQFDVQIINQQMDVSKILNNQFQ